MGIKSAKTDRSIPHYFTSLSTDGIVVLYRQAFPTTVAIGRAPLLVIYRSPRGKSGTVKINVQLSGLLPRRPIETLPKYRLEYGLADFR